MKNIKILNVFLVLAFILAGCSSADNQNQYEQKAEELAQEFVIVDGHVDIPYRLKNEWEDISESTPEGDFDYPRAKEGGLDAPFMSIYIPTSYQETGGAKAAADSLIDMVEKIAADNPDKFAVATSPQEIKSQFEEGLISLPMGMENGAPIEEISDVQYFYDQGIRYITLTHGEDNQIGDSSYDTTDDTHGGLSDFGREVIKEMNRVGIIVDISHVNDNTFHDAIDVTEAPVIASHSSARHFTPGFERNMSDELIERLAENDGVIMINFGSDFLDSASSNSREGISEEIEQKIKEKEWDQSSEAAEEFREKYFRENYKYSTVEKVADHIDHVVDLVGVDHVGFGSDFDGVGPTLPEGLKDPSDYPNLIAELLERGYTEEDIQKICSGNIFRVWNEVIEVADSLQNTEDVSE